MAKKYEASSVETQRPEKGAIDKLKKEGQLVQQIKTPYNLDFINKRDNSKVNKNKDSIIENVRLVSIGETIFEDEAVGMSSKILVQQEFAEIDQQARNQIMMGIDIVDQEDPA